MDVLIVFLLPLYEDPVDRVARQLDGRVADLGVDVRCGTLSITMLATYGSACSRLVRSPCEPRTLASSSLVATRTVRNPGS